VATRQASRVTVARRRVTVGPSSLLPSALRTSLRLEISATLIFGLSFTASLCASSTIQENSSAARLLVEQSQATNASIHAALLLRLQPSP
jgi:hypothetical protein